LRISIACLLLLAIAAPAVADYHYVSHTGSDEYPYSSWETAADSVHDAVAAADPGDTVFISSGEYEGPVLVNPEDCPIALIGAGMDSTHLVTPLEQNLITFGGDTYVQGLQFSTVRSYAALTTFVAGADITVEECRFAGTGYGILPVACDVIVRDCVFQNLQFSGIAEPFSVNRSTEVANCLFKDMYVEPVNIETQHVVIKNNIVANTCEYPAFKLYVAEGGYVSITNNVIYDICSGGMLMFVVDDTTSRVENNTLDNPTSYHNWDPAINVATSFDWRIFNNSITKADNGIRLAGDRHLSVHYSNFWNIAALDAYVAPGYNGSIDTSYGILHDDPMFLDSTDFHLQAFSPLIDAGDPNILDVDGSRSDIGCYGGPGGCSYVYLDLAPKIPDSLTASVDSVGIHMVWRANYEADFNRHQIFRDTVSGFSPSIFNMIAEPETSFYLDSDINPNTSYYYRLTSVDNQGNVSDYSTELAVLPTGFAWDDDGAVVPKYSVIESAFPNPFNSNVTIVYSASNLGPQPPEIKLVLYDIQGREVKTLVDERKRAGTYRVTWDGRDEKGQPVSSGTYMAKLTQWGCAAGDFPVKITLMK